MKYNIFPLGDNALTIDFGNKISVDLNNCVLNIARQLDQRLYKGLIETVPAYSSLTVFYDVARVRASFPEYPTAFRAVENIVENAMKNRAEMPQPESRSLRIPVCFAEEYALDLETMSGDKNISPEKAIEIFLDRAYRVFMLGFLPGFSYMGEVDKRIAAARKPAPRLAVPAGSVGIAGIQTGIYSLKSPGGWQIIGQTPLKLFTPDKTRPTFLQAGDEVRFYGIDKKTFTELKKSDSENRR